MKKSSMSVANAEPVSSVAANANRTNLARPDQPDQEGVEMSQDRPAPTTTRAPSSQDLSVSAGTVDGNPSADEPVSSLEELTAGESAADAASGAAGNVKVQPGDMSPPGLANLNSKSSAAHPGKRTDGSARAAGARTKAELLKGSVTGAESPEDRESA